MAELHGLTRTALVLAAVLAGYLAVRVVTGEAPTAGPITVTARPVDLYAPPRPERGRRVGALEFLVGLELRSDARDFGGFSGIRISPSGSRMLALSDAAFWLDAGFELEDGLPRGIRDARMAPLLGPEGPLTAREDRDPEALIRDPDGFHVAFEHHQRLLFYPAADPWIAPSPLLGTAGRPVAVPPAVLDNPPNGGLEAGVRLADGRLLLFSEETRVGPGVKRAWLVGPQGRAEPLAYRAAGGLGATAAARAPDGDIFLLLRSFTRLEGVSVVLRRIPAATIAPGAVLEGDDLARLAPPLTVDNFEGLDVRRDTAGRTLVYLISDDNFNPLQRTLLLVFAVVNDDSGS